MKKYLLLISTLLSFMQAQESIMRLGENKKVKIIVCAMSLNANAIEEKEVLPFISNIENEKVFAANYLLSLNLGIFKKSNLSHNRLTS